MANNFTFKKVKYTVLDNETVCVAKNDKFVGPLVIPEFIEKNAITYRVTSIERFAFNKSGITSVEIPGSIKEIPSYAFGETPLEKVALSEGTDKIGDNAFMCCKISSVSIPGSVRYIGEDSFQGCEALEEVTFGNPSAIEIIFSSSFEGTKWQSAQVKDSENLIIGNTLVMVNTKNKTYQVPEGIEAISPGAFLKCDSIKEVSFPEGMTKLSFGVFNECRSLERIKLPSSLKGISVGADRWSDGTFSKCSSLKEIFIPESVEEIGANCFNACQSLERISLPKSLHTIGRGAFSGCTALKDIVIPEGVTIMPAEVFKDCNSLTSIKLPESLAEIGESAFNGCYRLSSLIMPRSIKVIGRFAFWDCFDLADVVLNDGLEVINESVFGCCNSLKSIRIPGSVKRIGKNAFWSCLGLREVTIPDTIEKASVFTNCPSIGKNEKKSKPTNSTIEVLADPYECECFINLEEKEVQPYLQEEYLNPLDNGFDSYTVSFVEWGRYRSAAIDEKEVSIDSLFNRPMEYWGHQWQDHIDELQEVLSHLLPGHYGIIDRREIYKNSTVFRLELNGKPFNKNCLKLLKVSGGRSFLSPFGRIECKLVPDMAMSCNKLLYCGSVIEGEFQYDSGSQGKLLRIVFFKEDSCTVKIVAEYKY